MNNKPLVAIKAILAVTVLNVAHAQTDFTTTNGWVVDRYAPNSFNQVVFQARPSLELGIDPAQSLANRPAAYQYSFYNTQGYQRPSGLGPGTWTVAGSLYVSSAMLNGTQGPIRSDLWARTGPTSSETYADYFIVGLLVGDLASPADPNPTSYGTAWRVYDDVNGVWNNLSAPVNTGWNNLSISYDGSAVNYELNGTLVYSDTGFANASYANELSTVFLEAYNFGNNAYTVDWSAIGNAPLAVPEPPPAGFSVLGGLFLLNWILRHPRRRL